MKKLNLREVKRAIAEMINEKTMGEQSAHWFAKYGDEVSKDATAVADHPILDKINTKDEWVDIMKAVMDHGNSISTVSDSIKKTTLLDMVKTIGKKDTPQNGEL